MVIMVSEDVLLLHATLQLSALDLETVQGENRPSRTKLLLTKECISLLRERVEDPLLGLSDKTMAAILYLTIVEFERGNMKMVRLHINGLKRVASLADLLEVCPPDHALLLWFLSAGGLYVVAPEQLWFISQLVSIVEDMKIRSYEIYKSHPIEVIWVDACCERPFPTILG